MTSSMNPPVAPGEAAPDFALPAVAGPGTVSLADYRGRAPLFLALMVGLWCPFCRRQLVQIGKFEVKLKALGVESLVVVATDPENARLYFKFRPTRLRLASDPALSTHRAYRVAQSTARPVTNYRHEQSGEAEPAVLRLLLLHVPGRFHGVGAGGRRQRTGHVVHPGTRPVAGGGLARE